jgi:hydrogenase nickel incorporation protein HypA/HybF
MHELTIAASIVELAQEEAAKRGVRVLAVHVKLGPLSGVVRHALLGSYEIACAGTPLECSRLVVEDAPIVIFCRQCSQQRTVASMQWMRCPECGVPAPEVLQGAELQVTALEVES